MRIGRCLTPLTVLVLLWSGVLGAQSATSEEDEVAGKHRWSIDDILLAESVDDYRIAPDGRWVVWVKTRVDEETGGRVSNLILSSLLEDRHVQLTRGKDSHA